MSDDDNAELNAIIRVHFKPSDFNILNPPAIPPVEIDHFWEVQHIVQLIKPMIGENWYERRIGDFMDLSTFVNEHRNMFQITQADNQRKKNIPLANYPRDAFIRTYLNRRLQSGITVEDSVRELARAMRDRVSEYSELTRRVGRELCNLMGW